jgi:hypothetical protein
MHARFPHTRQRIAVDNDYYNIIKTKNIIKYYKNNYCSISIFCVHSGVDKRRPIGKRLFSFAVKPCGFASHNDVARYRLKKSIFRTTIFFLPTLHSEAA